MRSLVVVGLVLSGWATGGSLAAQGSRNTWSLQVDNDLFALWRGGQGRTDRDYSSGIELAVRKPLPPGESTWLGGLARPAAWRLALSQQIYTPDITAPRPVPDDRPYAAVLAGHGALEWRRGPWRHELGVALGVTGRPALGEEVQRFVHQLVGSPPPVGWENQLPFRAGFLLGYTGARELVRRTEAAGFGVAVAGTWGVDLGTILTRATIGGRARFGYRPGDLVTRASGRGLRVYGILGAELDAVERILVLDAPVDEAGTPLARRPVVARLEAGLAIEAGALTVGWTGHLTGREYQGQSRAPAFGRITISLH